MEILRTGRENRTDSDVDRETESFITTNLNSSHGNSTFKSEFLVGKSPRLNLNGSIGNKF